ncbi:metal-dependent hydrolase [Halarchaeum sp. CBA1220]|uniref:metal-dependent hydrolase n=1 Tax=Halarchaeum sp. CBA1220 TaxID=1853682 RepID=UPI000F3AA193|nr:metal-dependent hydrolase [Halarchaeum sp. CBA1220]QLC32750.1 metal-dependent hydrolase [Halarchaeum sp. CBA1220]
MFVGHETIAFALVALLAYRYGLGRERALALGVAAGLFAAVPDVDMAYAPLGLLAADASSPLAAANAFWSASTVVHRAVTHSLVLAPLAAATFALAASRRYRVLAGVGTLALVGVAAVVSGGLAAAVIAVYSATGIAVAVLAARYLDLGVGALAAAALAGLITHPFGDLLTGEPPHFLYPFAEHLLTARPVLFADPTLDLLAAFALELACIWAGVYAYHRVSGVPMRRHLHGRAAAGGAYALAALVITPPTLQVSYHFVFSVAAVGVVGLVQPLQRRLPDAPTALVTGLAAVTAAGAGYTLAYLLL